MTVFVVARMIGETPLDYLPEKGYGWVESPAVAKWYHTEEEAEADREHWAHAESGNLQVRTYDPTETLINPSEIDQTAMIQVALREMLRGN